MFHVHAGVQPRQYPAPYQALDVVWLGAECVQLPPRDHAALLPEQLGQRLLVHTSKPTRSAS